MTANVVSLDAQRAIQQREVRRMKKWIPLIFGFGFVTLVLVTLSQLFFGMGSQTSITKSMPAYYGEGEYDVPISQGLGSLTNPVLPGISSPRQESKTILPQPEPFPIVPDDDALEVDERVYQKSARFDIVTKKVAEYMQQMKEYVLSIEGRVLNSSMQSAGKITYGQMYIKVPVAKFEETNSRVVSGVLEVVNEQVSSEDETGKVVSLQEQLTELEDQLLEKQLELEKETDEIKRRRLQAEITRIENQIKQLKARMEGVEATVEYASVYLRVANTITYFDASGERSVDLQDEAREAWSSVLAILLILARVVIWVTIYGILWLPVVMVVRFIVNKFFGHKEEEKK